MITYKSKWPRTKWLSIQCNTQNTVRISWLVSEKLMITVATTAVVTICVWAQRVTTINMLLIMKSYITFIFKK